MKQKSLFGRCSLAFLLSALSVCAGIPACSGSDDSQKGEEERTDDIVEECQAIGDVCGHGGPGTLEEECHGYYHDNDASVCAEHEAECVAYCTNGGEGGAGGHGGSQHHDH